MNKKAVWVVLGFCLVMGVSAEIPSITLQSIKGKVEVRIAGTSTWTPASEGEVLSLATTLSTGFDSSVVVVMGKTTLQVKPLTRMTVDKLVEEGGTLKTTTFLRVGSISASVKSAEGVKQDFKVQSPYSTASVRGTKFTYDGLNLNVTEGVVNLVPGRPQREGSSQVNGGSSRGASPSSDFVGAPDLPADPNKLVPVPAGTDAKILVDFQGAPPKTSSSNDLDSLRQSSGQVQTLPTAPTTPPKTATTGGITLTIQIGP